MQSQAEKVFSQYPHILVVDDDDRIANLVCRYLKEHDFVALRAEDAKQARILIDNIHFDAMVLDIMMPGETGLEFTRDLQKQNKNIPIILLTALGEVDDKIEGFEAGADDYLPKPFEPKELLLRLEALLRRTKKEVAKQIQYKIGRWVFDAEFRLLKDGDKQIPLTQMEINLINVLLQTPGEVVAREDLAERCNLDAMSRSIDVQVTRLRKKIEEDSKTPLFLQTVRGKGYLLRVEKI